MPDAIEVVVETPQGSRNKMKFDPERGLFRLGHVLPVGMSFPFDFGFVPGTRADDGDPVDVLILADGPLPMGSLVDVRLIGVIEAEQTGDGAGPVRNDRLIGVAEESTTHRPTRDLSDVSRVLLSEIEAFFAQYNRLEGREFRVLHRRGAAAAAERIRAALIAPEA
jgi:inorganic pyrophosphatase